MEGNITIQTAMKAWDGNGENVFVRDKVDLQSVYVKCVAF